MLLTFNKTINNNNNTFSLFTLVSMAMKRKFAAMESLDMAKCLILFSQTLQNNTYKPTKHIESNDIFECKTCNRKFPSFQALGGHRASHKKPKTILGNTKASGEVLSVETMKPKMHECSICGVEFALGQALGGHMRKHRAANAVAMTERLSSNGKDHHGVHVVSKLPVLRRSTSCKRVFGLDLNLTPLENDLEYLFGKMAPKVDPFV